MYSLNDTALESNKYLKINFDGGNLSFDAGLLLFKKFLFKIGAVKLINRIVYWSSLIFIINCSAGFEKT